MKIANMRNHWGRMEPVGLYFEWEVDNFGLLYFVGEIEDYIYYLFVLAVMSVKGIIDYLI